MARCKFNYLLCEISRLHRDHTPSTHRLTVRISMDGHAESKINDDIIQVRETHRFLVIVICIKENSHSLEHLCVTQCSACTEMFERNKGQRIKQLPWPPIALVYHKAKPSPNKDFPCPCTLNSTVIMKVSFSHAYQKKL